MVAPAPCSASTDAPGTAYGFSGFPMIVKLGAAAPARCSLDMNLITLLNELFVVLSLLHFPFLILKELSVSPLPSAPSQPPAAVPALAGEQEVAGCSLSKRRSVISAAPRDKTCT